METRKIILSDEFFEEPVKGINREIDSGKSKKTILYGPRGGGKSIVLSYREYETIGTPAPAILTHFDAVGKFLGFDDWFISHYYELEMARYIISYIKKYHGKIYESRFLKLHERINGLTREIDNYFHNHFYQNIELSQKLKTGDICNQLLDEFRKALTPKSVSLLIDHFDSTDCNSVIAQKTLAGYFELFDQIVLAVSDISIYEAKIKGWPGMGNTELIDKGYSLVSVDYGKDLATIKKIVELYVAHYNANKLVNEKRFPIELLTDEMYELLLKRSRGNISKVLVAIRQAIKRFDFESVKDIFNYYFDTEEEAKRNMVAKGMTKKIKFHL
ncbi:MAG TPA: hypothetical protein PLX66_02620 [Bacilli bacterium]|nr:hypothetical protein [Bacilli bacterium]